MRDTSELQMFFGTMAEKLLESKYNPKKADKDAPTWDFTTSAKEYSELSFAFQDAFYEWIKRNKKEKFFIDYEKDPEGEKELEEFKKNYDPFLGYTGD